MMNNRYLTEKEKIAIYAIQHPDTPIGTVADQRRALMKSYGNTNTDTRQIKNRMIRAILIIGLIFVLFLLAVCEPHLLYITLL